MTCAHFLRPDDAFRDGAEAMRIAVRLCEKSKWKEPGNLVELAAAYAENRDFEKAIMYLQKASDLLCAVPNRRIERHVSAMKTLFAKGHPYRR